MNKMYVCFDLNSGEILRIANEVYDTDNYVEVDISEVMMLQTGEEPTCSYMVKYNLEKNTYEFKVKDDLEINTQNINNLIYQIPADNLTDPDLTLVQDFYNTCCKFFIGKNFKKNITNQTVSLNKKLQFSVTVKDDPNILYKTFVVDFAETVKQNYSTLPFTEEFENKLVDLSIYTTRRFNTYQYKRIKNGQEV